MTHAELPVRTRPLGVSPDTDILWPSGPLPGSVHDKKAEWVWAVPAELEAGPIVLADMGYQGAAHAKAPYRGKNKPESQNDANRVHAKLRSPGERANAQLKTWRILRKLRCCPWRAGQLAKAIRALQIRQANAGRRVGSWRGGIVRRQVPQPLFPGFPLRAASLR